ncbi:MAG: erythromycin esterase family protein [Acidobacteria bacterium]|nr:erythromycin esterase family protein [Acidobacteriota bacterium]
MRPLILLFLASFPNLSAQGFFNLDYEVILRDRLAGWFTGVSNGYEYAIEDTTSASGRISYRIRSLTAPDGALGVISILLPPDQLRGRRLKISGAMRTQTIIAPGYAAIWFRVDGDAGILSLENMSRFAINGTTGWTNYSYEVDVNPAATRVIFGTFLAGRGIAWFDNLQVEVDGKPLPQTAPPYIGEPIPAQKSWIVENAIPFRTEKAGTGFDDLQPLKTLIGNARVVGLGEATHGTAEFFRMKHRLVEFLSNEMGFTVFAIEANMPEAYALNDYILNGRGDPKKLLQGMYFWTWNTQEVLEMVEWMRTFNASGRGRILFTGFDMQYAPVAAGIVRTFVNASDSAYTATLTANYAKVTAVVSLQPAAANQAQILDAAFAARDVRIHLESLNGRAPELDWAIQNARVVEQATFVKIGGGAHRDEMMALNTRWILDQNPNAKMVIWAHNYHVSRVAGAQGSYLAKFLGTGYVNLGFAFYSGRFSALSVLPNGSFGPLNSNNIAGTPYPGTIEYMFHETGLPRFILDFRKVRADNDGSWLLSAMDGREVGSVAVDGFFSRPLITKDFDALIYIDQTTNSVLLPFN